LEDLVGFRVQARHLGFVRIMWLGLVRVSEPRSQSILTDQRSVQEAWRRLCTNFCGRMVEERECSVSGNIQTHIRNRHSRLDPL
jgi:hypothetical protein